MESKVKCAICGKEASILSSHLRVHGLKPKEYREIYNSPTASEEWIERNRKKAKENNPMHNPEVRKNFVSSMKNPETARKNAEARKGRKNTEEQKKRISEARKGKGLGNRNAMKRLEVVRKMAEAQRGQKRPSVSGKNNPRWGKPSPAHSGYIKPKKYTSTIAGEVTIVGSYELRMSKILDKLGWKWEKEPEYFEYTKIDGKPSTYTPDFRVIKPCGTILYIETKGYYPEQDQHKCTSIQDMDVNLLVLTKKLLESFEKAVM